MAKYMIGVDQSTTGTKALIFDENAQCICRVDIEHKQYYPSPGWVEHDPLEIYNNLVAAIKNVLRNSGIASSDILAISITNQRETVMLWDEYGAPAYKAVVWQCARAEEIMQRPEIANESEYITKATGLGPSPYFSAGKAMWLMEHIENKGKQLFFGNMDSWIIYKLTGNHATDYSNASRTQLFNINTLKWDERLVGLFGLDDVKMPDVKYSDEIFGYTTVEGVFDNPVPVAGVMGDSHGALFAQHCWEKGMAKCTFGTGGSISMNIGKKPIPSRHRINTSIAWGLGGSVDYVFEGMIICMGDTIKWLRDEMGILENSAQSEQYAEKVNSAEGVYLVPAFIGLGTPYWMPNVRALICGMHRHTNKYHIVRAGLEAIAYLVCDIIDAMQKDADLQLAELRVDGGPANNAFLMQFVSDVLRKDVVPNSVEELSALGAVYAGGLAVGYWENLDEIQGLRKTSQPYHCKMPEVEFQKLYDGWHDAVEMVISAEKRNTRNS